PKDVEAEGGGARGSWGGHRKGANLLRHRPGILKVDVLWGDLHIAQRGLNVGMTHQLHEGGQADTGADHVRGKGRHMSIKLCLKAGQGSVSKRVSNMTLS